MEDTYKILGITSKFMATRHLVKTQKEILRVVAASYPQVYLVGGTAVSLLYHHRTSEDLDFFTQEYSKRLHQEITADIKRETGYPYALIEEELRKKYVPMAVYEFEVGKGVILKVDFVEDVTELIKPRGTNGIASIEDIYCRKILAAIGWEKGKSRVGKVLAGGRQKTKDLFDIFCLSSKVGPLSDWFPKYFDRSAYERLAAWYLGIPKQRTVMELLELVPKGDTQAIFKHLDGEIIEKLNRKYFSI